MRDPGCSNLLLKDCTPWKGSMLEQFVKSCVPGKDSCWRCLWRTVSCGMDPTVEQGKSEKNPLSEEEGKVEKIYNELTTTPIPYLPVLVGGGGRENGE